MRKIVLFTLLLIISYSYADVYYVKVNALNVHFMPSTESKIVKVLSKGDKVNVIEKSNNWGKIDEAMWIYLPLASSEFVSKEKSNISKISNYAIKRAVRNFCSPLACSNWSIGNPKDAVGEPNYAVEVYCDCEHPEVPEYVLKAHFYVLISKSTLEPVRVIDVNE